MSEKSGTAVLDPPVSEPPPAPVRRKRKRHKHNLAGYGFLAPWLIGLFAFTLIPMVYSLYLSLTKFNLLTAPQWIGLENYTRLFSDERYLQSIKVTLLYVVTSTKTRFESFGWTITYSSVSGLSSISPRDSSVRNWRRWRMTFSLISDGVRPAT